MTLKHARGNFRALNPFLKAVDESPRGWRRFTAGGFMPLSVERLYYEQGGFPVYSICHYGVQNGDLNPCTYENSYAGAYDCVYTDDGVRKSLQRDLDAFLSDWLKNVAAQGFDAAVFDQD